MEAVRNYMVINQSFSGGKTSFYRDITGLFVSSAFAIAQWVTSTRFPSAVFNVGEYRRDAVKVFADKDFFDPDNARAVAVRK